LYRARTALQENGMDGVDGDELQALRDTAEALRNENNYLKSLLEHERGNFAAVEADRVARGNVIEEQGRAVSALHAEVDKRLKELTALYDARERLRAELALHAAVLECLTGEGPRPGAGDPFLGSLREYNHKVVEELAGAVPLAGRRVLDIGASPHGFALEWALRRGAAEYVGIGLDMPNEFTVRTGSGTGRLLQMNAEALDLADASFDAALSISTFEHIGRLDLALAEAHRVLRPGGCLLVVFEPVWTSSVGHHLHHFGGDVASQVPDWAHLLWSPAEMAAHLEPRWPAQAPLTAAQAVTWIYESDELNRIGIDQVRKLVSASPFRVRRMDRLQDAPGRDASRLALAQAKTGLGGEDLLTRGLSMLLERG
jgi:SAM-dependent methyltransferase